MFVGSVIVLGVVTTLVLVAALRRRGDEAPPQTDPPLARRLVLWGGAIVPLAVLVGLFALILHTIPSTSAAQATKGRLTIKVVGRQWFWDVFYPQQHFASANELHIPVGVPVRLEARTADVIHSFWVPALNRKIDMIPGKKNHILLQANRAGTYRGQCAEFCGLEHGEMAFIVVAEPRARFRRWVARQQKQSAGGSGASVFMQVGCGSCHRIRGTKARGDVGPDLTHVGSRAYLAAGATVNDEESLREWIRDPQHVKPGVKMPGLSLTNDQVRRLAAYLRSLR
jgi:cytochrome c oxidase subunit II